MPRLTAAILPGHKGKDKEKKDTSFLVVGSAPPPPPPPPPPLWCGGRTHSPPMGGEGRGGSIFWKTPYTALYSTYVSTLWWSQFNNNKKARSSYFCSIMNAQRMTKGKGSPVKALVSSAENLDPDPDPDPWDDGICMLVRGTDPDPDPSIIKEK